MINITEPKLVDRNEQHYVAIRKLVSMAEIGPTLPPLSDDVFAWLAEKGIQPSGAVFWRYNVVEMDKKLEIDVAVPVASPIKGDGQGVCVGGRECTWSWWGGLRVVCVFLG